MKEPEPQIYKCPYCDFQGCCDTVIAHIDYCLENPENWNCETCAHLDGHYDDETGTHESNCLLEFVPFSGNCNDWVPKKTDSNIHETAIVTYGPFEYRRP